MSARCRQVPAVRSGTAQAMMVSGNVVASPMLVASHIASGMSRRERRLLGVLLVASLEVTPAADAVAAAVEVIAPAAGAAIKLMAVMLRGTTEILAVVSATLWRTEMMLRCAEVMGAASTTTKSAATHVMMSAAKSAAAHMVAAAPESATSVMPPATHVASTSPASSVTMTCRQI